MYSRGLSASAGIRGRCSLPPILPLLSPSSHPVLTKNMDNSFAGKNNHFYL
ncbi:hypothetical protein FDUTEX481_06433 [Tolypothrix sp. PCC 7601]|nr:hypothetical protein FDUTEX481_06433 [Tolypothrix sp. PCC 7601]